MDPSINQELNSKEGVSRGRASMDAAGVPTYIQDQDSELIQDLRDALLETVQNHTKNM